MTDDSNARYRSSDPFSHTPGSGEQGSDPLAELARLIGQSDPFAEFGRDGRATAPREPQYGDPAPPSEPPYGDRTTYDARHDAPYSHDPAPAPEWHSPPAPSYDPFVSPAYQTPAAAAPGDRGYDEAADHQTHAFHLDPPAQPSYVGHDAPHLSAGSRHGQGFESPLPFASDSGSMPSHAEDFYDDAPQGGRRKGLVTVAAVLCLAVVGTAGAFGYRTWFGDVSVKAPPPVIRASAEPSKVAPPPSADPSANKISYDRFGDRGQNEQVVPREEKPVDLKDAARSGPARAALPTAPQPTPAASATANPPSVLTEPKRVRTVPIRPDAAETISARPQMTAPAPARSSVAAAAPSNAPLDLANPASPPPPQVRASASRAAPPPAVPSANAPLSLSPDSSPPAAAAPVRSAPTRVASAPAGNGSYLVQVSSQRSEADAQAAFRNIQSKYSSVLGDRQPVIRRAELAGKGTYFRAMVGPFASRDQAIQLCSSLKSAGGDCVVQSN